MKMTNEIYFDFDEGRYVVLNVKGTTVRLVLMGGQKKAPWHHNEDHGYISGMYRNPNYIPVVGDEVKKLRKLGKRLEINILGGGFYSINKERKILEFNGNSISQGSPPRDLTEKLFREFFQDYEMHNNIV